MVTAFGTDTVPASGQATLLFTVEFQRFATDPALGGDYVVVATPMSAEGVYWDKAASNADRFVVRSATGKAAPFSYYIAAARVSFRK